MANKKRKTEKKKVDPQNFEGYSIAWLRNLPEHPDHSLVHKYDLMVLKGRKNK